MVAFAGIGFSRTSKEIYTIKRLWNEDMTISKLMNIVKSGQELPELVLMRGSLASRGKPVRTATT